MSRSDRDAVTEGDNKYDGARRVTQMDGTDAPRLL